ncbi:MAG: hypothetical protein EXR47_07325 [Dehalococcoidia bacterium]|nr:hypothetical protein [Dehalococcoidia bacterium]
MSDLPSAITWTEENRQLHHNVFGVWPEDCDLCRANEPLYRFTLTAGDKLLVHKSQLSVVDEDEDVIH